MSQEAWFRPAIESDIVFGASVWVMMKYIDNTEPDRPSTYLQEHGVAMVIEGGSWFLSEDGNLHSCEGAYIKT